MHDNVIDSAHINRVVRGGITAFADHHARAQVGRVVRLERLHQPRCREGRAAVRRRVVRDRIDR